MVFCYDLRDTTMAYLLPRAVLIIIAWAMTCALIKKLWPEAEPMVFGVAGATWVFGGGAYFAYLRKLRRDIEELERARRYSVNRSAT
jgi:hypothetical protein